MLGITDIPSAVKAAETLGKLAESDSAQLTGEQDDFERKELMTRLGVAEDSKLNASSRSQLKKLEESQKRRATRSKRDGLDRILVDLMGLYRDVLTVQLGAGESLINVDLVSEVDKLASETSQAQTIHCIEQIEKVRSRMDRNVREDLLLNSLAVSLRRKANK